MATDEGLKYGRRLTAFYIPCLLGFTVNVNNLNAGILMTGGAFVAWLYGQLVWRHGEAKAKARREWVRAENESLRPAVEAGARERAQLADRVSWLEEQLRQAIAAERGLAILSLVRSGDMEIRDDAPPPPTGDY